MSYKTDRLVDLFPEAFSARDRSSLLYKLLDAMGAELMQADATIKDLLKSHWVDYAAGLSLDGLGAIYGVERRRLVDGSLEPDAAFRLRLKSVVPLFTGGGTRRAVLGAVRSALGLPFDLDQLNLPPQFVALRQELEDLVRLEEFSPHPERLLAEITNPAEAGELLLDVPIPSVFPEPARLEWVFTHGSGRRLRLELVGSGLGFLAEDSLLVPQGEVLRISGLPGGGVSAFLGTTDVSALLHGLSGGDPLFPDLPPQGSQWLFQAEGGLFDSSTYDSPDTFDPPLFRVEMTWTSHQPLSFDVYVPYFLHSVVAALVSQYNFPGEIFVYEGLDLETIQAVVNQSRAAGVRGNVHFSLNFLENHALGELFQLDGLHHVQEMAEAQEAMLVRADARLDEPHELIEHFAVGGVYDFSTFDSVYGFT